MPTKSLGSENDSDSAFFGLPRDVPGEDQRRALVAWLRALLHLSSRRVTTIPDTGVVVAANGSPIRNLAGVGAGILFGCLDLGEALAISNFGVGGRASSLARLLSEYPSLSMGHPVGIHTLRRPRRHGSCLEAGCGDAFS